MNFRTIINAIPSPDKITYNDKVMFAGSCFAAYMGEKLEDGKMQVMINPSGTVYNPVSVLNTLDSLVTGKITTEKDLFSYNGSWLSFLHYTDFSSEDPIRLSDKINDCNERARLFLKDTGFLFITFGTARVYRLKESGMIVSNCHKVPDSRFDKELLYVDEIVNQWYNFLERLSEFNPGLKVIFTVSPVRHWKDGAHGNQVSKSILFLAVEELLKHKVAAGYFPAYELLIDDLRDYRFYSEDMLHPSDAAVEYIFEKFTDTYMDEVTLNLWKEISKIRRSYNHRVITGSLRQKEIFASGVLKQISAIQNKLPFINLSVEKEYFESLRNK